jgi:hypothetical protein
MIKIGPRPARGERPADQSCSPEGFECSIHDGCHCHPSALIDCKCGQDSEPDAGFEGTCHASRLETGDDRESAIVPGRAHVPGLRRCLRCQNRRNRIVHSCLNATVGSSREARQAGMKVPLIPRTSTDSRPTCKSSRPMHPLRGAWRRAHVLVQRTARAREPPNCGTSESLL